MGKYKRKKTLLISALATCASLFLPISITSCKSEQDGPQDSEIQVFNKQQFVTQRLFTVPFSISSLPLSPVSVQIVDEDTGYLSIENQQIFLDSKNGKIDFVIDPSVIDDTDFHFGVEFLFINSANKYQTIQVGGLDVYYVDDPVKPVDDLVPKERTVYEVNNHTFNFAINLYKKPTSEKALVHLVDNPTGAVIRDDIECPFVQVPGHNIFYIDIPIYLSLTECQTSEHPFTLEVTFTNSFGEKQKTLVTDLNAFFVSDPQETIPSDYYNITKKQVNGEEQNILLGLKPEISREEAGRYSRMVIPNSVTHIAPGAFIDHKWFNRIDYIKLGSNVKSIGDAALVGCTHTFEFDVSGCQNTSSWLDEPSILFNKLDYEFGFVWFNDTDNMSESMNKLRNKGVPSDWSEGRANLIVPDAFYKFDTEEPTKLIGIRDESVAQLHKYKIIRLPKKTTKIEANSLDDFGHQPYRRSSDLESIELRQLLIGNQITELHCLPKGVNGHVTFRCSALTKLEQNIANSMTVYPDHPSHYGDISFDLSPMSGLVEIEESAFANIRMVGTFLVPQSVRKIGAKALGYIDISKFILSYPLCQDPSADESIGEQAFCKWCGRDSELDIDFSVYTALPTWLPQNLNLFDIDVQPTMGATIWVNKNTSDEDLKSWKQNLNDCHRVPVEGIFKHPVKNYWKVERKPY